MRGRNFKLKFLLLLAVITSFTACKYPKGFDTETKFNFKISVSVENTEIKTAKLYKIAGGQPLLLDSALVSKNGNIIFESDAKEPFLALLNLGSEQDIVFILDTTQIDISAKGYEGGSFKVSASQQQKLYESFLAKRFEKKMQIMGLQKKWAESSSRNDTLAMEEIKKEKTIQDSTYIKFCKEIISKSDLKCLGSIIANTLDPDLTFDYLVSLDSNFKNLDEKTVYQEEFMKAVESVRYTSIGSLAQEITLNDPENKIRKLSDLKGKVVLIDFWASWCGPCREENPNVRKNLLEFQNKGFEIFAVSLDRSKEKWIEAIQSDSLNWVQVSDLKFWEAEYAIKYKVEAIPTNFLIGQDGKIIAKNLFGNELNVFLKNYFQK